MAIATNAILLSRKSLYICGPADHLPARLWPLKESARTPGAEKTWNAAALWLQSNPSYNSACPMAHAPIAFISSTSDDLPQHREQAARAAQASGFMPLMMEYFPAGGSKPSLAACIEQVAKAEVVITLVAHRYGWVPSEECNTEAKSITWLECEHAVASST